MQSGQFLHYLDGEQVPEPGKWEEFTEEIERSWDLRLIAVQYPNTVIFNGGGYELLRDMYIEGLCSSLEYRCDFFCGGKTYVVARAQLNISDIEWNLNKCEATCKLADDGFGARINNNKSIKVFLDAPNSKNGTSIGECPSFDLEVFDSQDPEPDYLPNPAKAYDWLEAMNYVVRFITDDAITVNSPWYDSLNTDEKYAIVTGLELRKRTGTNQAPEVSFKQLFESMWKKYNLWAVVTRASGGDPILSILQDGDTYGEGVAFSLPNQDDLEQSTDLERMYSSVRLGDEKEIKDYDGLEDIPFLPMATYCTEEYYIEGTCNTDSQLDLVMDYPYGHNIINAIRGGTTDNDDDPCIIQYSDYSLRATKSDWFNPGSTPYLYNEALRNIKIANRWRLQAAGVQVYNAQEANFAANRTGIVPNPVYTSNTDGSAGADITRVLRYDDDYTPPFFDTDNAWGNGTTQGNPVSEANSRYTAPAIGWYVFSGFQPWELLTSVIGAQSQGTVCQQGGYLRVTVKRYNAANVNIETDHYDGTAETIPGVYGFSFQHSTLLNTGDYLIFYYVLSTTGVSSICPRPPFATYGMSSRLLRGGTIQTDFVSVGGGEIVGSDDDSYRTINYKFSRALPIEEWIALRDDPTLAIQVATDATSMRIGHAQKLTREIATGSCDIELVANRQQAYK